MSLLAAPSNEFLIAAPILIVVIAAALTLTLTRGLPALWRLSATQCGTVVLTRGPPRHSSRGAGLTDGSKWPRRLESLYSPPEGCRGTKSRRKHGSSRQSNGEFLNYSGARLVFTLDDLPAGEYSYFDKMPVLSYSQRVKAAEICLKEVVKYHPAIWRTSDCGASAYSRPARLKATTSSMSTYPSWEVIATTAARPAWEESWLPITPIDNSHRHFITSSSIKFKTRRSLTADRSATLSRGNRGQEVLPATIDPAAGFGCPETAWAGQRAARFRRPLRVEEREGGSGGNGTLFDDQFGRFARASGRRAIAARQSTNLRLSAVYREAGSPGPGSDWFVDVALQREQREPRSSQPLADSK